MPLELVAEQEKDYQLQEMVVDGVKLLVELREGGDCRIRQILSSDPMVFLNPRFQPGTAIDWIPQVKE